jgi:hypothetical protein
MAQERACHTLGPLCHVILYIGLNNESLKLKS